MKKFEQLGRSLSKEQMKSITGGQWCLLHDMAGQAPDIQFLCSGCDDVDMYHPTDACRDSESAWDKVPKA